MAHPIHRTIHPGDKGGDVRTLQQVERKALQHRKLGFLAPEVDGERGVQTTHATAQLAYAEGLSGKTIRHIRSGPITERVQRLLRSPWQRGPIARARALARKPVLRKWRKSYREHHPDVPPVITAMLAEQDHLVSKDMPYLWGGGHGTPANEGPGDCSWNASRLCQIAVPGMATGTTFTLATDSHLADGQGEFLTLYIKNIPAHDAHVIMEFSGKCFADGQARWCETGGRDNTRRGGPCWFNPTASRIAEFPIRRHIPGL